MPDLSYRDLDLPGGSKVRIRDDEPTLDEAELCLDLFAGGESTGPAEMLRVCRRLTDGIVVGMDGKRLALGALKVVYVAPIFGAALAWFKEHQAGIMAALELVGKDLTPADEKIPAGASGGPASGSE